MDSAVTGIQYMPYCLTTLRLLSSFTLPRPKIISTKLGSLRVLWLLLVNQC